jgi:tetratricopeptide (TPR) repeat protein
MTSASFISRFSPQRSSPEDLEAILVQREALLRDCVDKVSTSISTENKHQQLLVGPRGAGKTHLLTLIQYRIGKSKKLKDKYFVAWLGEDDLSTSFLRLMVRIYQHLQQRYADAFDAAALQEIFGLDAEIARAKLEHLLVERIGKKTLVLLIENLDAQLKQMSEAEQRNWRGFVQNHRIVATVASAQRLTEELTEQKHCFHGFYQVRHLMPLQVDDARAMLGKLATLRGDVALSEFLATSRGRARVQAIHHLAGGNPRLYVILSEFLNREGLESLVQPFEQMVDTQLTAYYQERMRWLSPQQQEIVQLLCRQRLPMAVKDIAAQLFNSQQTISSQLKLLKDLGYVAPHSVGRESHYELAEPLMRLTWQVKQSDAGKPLALLVDLLRIWFDRSELSERLSALPTGSHIAPYIAEALDAFTRGEPNLRDEMHWFSLGLIDEAQCDEQELTHMIAIAEDLNEPKAWLKLAQAMFHHGRYAQALDSATKVINAEQVSAALRAIAIWIRMRALRCLNRNEDAGADVARLKNIGNSDPNIQLLAAIVEMDIPKAFSILEALLANSKSETSKSNLLMARAQLRVACDDDNGAIDDLTQVISFPETQNRLRALKLRGKCLFRKGNFAQSLSDAADALSADGLSNKDSLELHVLRAKLYDLMQKPGAALADFQLADGIELGKNSDSAYASLKAFSGLATHLVNRLEISSIAPAAFLRFLSRLDAESKLKYENVGIQGPLNMLFFSIRQSESSIEHLTPTIRKIGVELAVLGWLNHLGSALISELHEWQPKSYKGEKLTRRAWLKLWQSMADTHVELEIPVRIMQVAFELFDTGDEHALLKLPLEEREILRQALARPEVNALQGTKTGARNPKSTK